MDAEASESTDDDAAEPAPRARRTRRPARVKREKPSRVPRYSELGPPPVDDSLAMNEWMHRVLGVSAAQVVRDPDLTDSQRRSQLCDLASRMAALTPQSRIFKASQVVTGEAAFQANGAGGPEMESVSDVEAVAVSAASSGSKARRGRPRKRGLA